MSYIGNPISVMDFPVDYFTGDGTSTTFQLSRIPASATSILVHIGGVKQVASTTDPAYYLDGSKLVFVSPPGAYSPIEVNYLGIAGQVNIPGAQSVTQDMLSLQLANTFVYQTTANGATASFTLNAPPVSANSLVVSANGVVQYDYSTNGNTLTFGFTPPVGTFIRVTSLALAQAGVPADGSVTSVKLGANLTITGNTTFDGFAGNPGRIRGDFSNATIASRAAFQSSTTNGNTVVGALPNGTGSVTSFQTFNNSDPTNAAAIGIVATSTDMRLSSFITGTGTYLPMTFLTGGSERMRIDTSGNVAIGVASSTFPLTVQSSSTIAAGNPAIVLQGQSNTERLHVRSAGNTGVGTPVIGAFAARGTIASPTAVQSGDPIAYYQMGGYDGTSYQRGAWILGYAGENWSATNRGTYMVFSTTPVGSTTIAEAMRIDSTGNVGIGTSSPASLLHLNKSSGASDIRLSVAGTLYGNIYASSSDLTINSVTSIPLTLGTNGTERMRIDSSGNVGIGTSSPQDLLDVRNTTDYQLRLGYVGANNYRIGRNITNGFLTFYGSQNSNTGYVFSGVDGEWMRINGSGNVGIGITNPFAKLHVYGTAAASNLAIRVQNTATDGYSTVHLGDENAGIFRNGSTQTAYGGANSLNLITVGAHNISFSTSNTERMRINSAGYITMPAQPVFSTYIGTGATTSVSVSSNQIIPCTAVVNVSSSFNNSTYRFTAPVTGNYQFNTNVEIQATSSGRFGIAFRKNGSVYVADIEYYDPDSASAGQWQNASMSCVIPLTVGDYVELWTETVPSGAVVWYSPNPGGNGNFSGYLIG